MIGYIFVLLVASFFFADWLTLRLRGDCDLALRPDHIENAFSTREKDRLRLRFDVPLENRSLKEQALVIFGNVQFVPEKKEDKLVEAWARITLAGSPRSDGYFEATLVKPGKRVPLRVECCFENGGGTGRLEGRAALSFEIAYGYYGRRPMTTDRVMVSVPVARFTESAEAFAVQARPTPAKRAKKSNVFPVATHLIYPGEDLSGIVRTYTREIGKPGDWIAIAESVVAIAQGRVYPVQSIRPGFWACRLNRFFQFNSSLASCYSMELAIREAGLARVMLGVAVGLLGRLVGRSGDFYRIAGRGVATIDDCTGTLPPFDKSVVLGPKDPDKVAARIREETGLEAAVVDANDLGKVDILGKSGGIEDAALVEAIRDNPQGNADEQTPIVLIKR